MKSKCVGSIYLIIWLLLNFVHQQKRENFSLPPTPKFESCHTYRDARHCLYCFKCVVLSFFQFRCLWTFWSAVGEGWTSCGCSRLLQIRIVICFATTLKFWQNDNLQSIFRIANWKCFWCTFSQSFNVTVVRTIYDPTTDTQGFVGVYQDNQGRNTSMFTLSNWFRLLCYCFLV
jgi:hypothetical protein